MIFIFILLKKLVDDMMHHCLTESRLHGYDTFKALSLIEDSLDISNCQSISSDEV